MNGGDIAGKQRLYGDAAGLDPLAPVWVTPDDILMLGVRNQLGGVQLSVEARLWAPDGAFNDPAFQVTPPNDSALRFSSVQLGYGYLVSAGVQAIGGTLPHRGQTYCTLMVVRPPAATFRLNHPLASGYVTGSNFVGWPYGRIQDAVEGPGVLARLGVGNPAAGADFSISVTGNQRWRVRGLTATLVTSAAVATRRVNLIVDDGGTTFYSLNTSVTQAASLTNVYDWIPGWPTAPALIDQIDLFLPNDLYLTQGNRLRSQTDNLQGGDQFSAINVFTESWLDD